jgi:hypothetical protein
VTRDNLSFGKFLLAGQPNCKLRLGLGLSIYAIHPIFFVIPIFMEENCNGLHAGGAVGADEIAQNIDANVAILAVQV